MRLIAVLAACGIAFAGCGSNAGRDTGTAAESAPRPASETPSQPAATPMPTATSTDPSPKTTGAVIKSAKSEFGTMLFDSTGQAIYLFDKEQTTKPECYGACAEAWPPVLTKGEPTAASGARQNLLGTTKRNGGATQVTYGGNPLYYYAHEGKNEVKCHNIQGFGGLWLVVTPAGQSAAP
jgi:predicted lipoprotein with Yx(FWY)xxD motif